MPHYKGNDTGPQCSNDALCKGYIMKTETYTLPAHWASALINDDESGMDDDEISAMNAWLEYAKPGYCIDCGEETFFCKWHDAIGYSLAGDCLEFTFQVIA